MLPPKRPKIYHIIHVDRLASIVTDGRLWCDAEVQRRTCPGTTIGMSELKQRRRTKRLGSHPDVCVSDCVPFYFCPRSVMLYLIYKANHPKLDYREGQAPIVHLEADLHEVVKWADRKGRRWAFTLSNAASNYFKDCCDVAQLDEMDWTAVNATMWQQCKEEKQAEFLVERSFPWKLIRRVGVSSSEVRKQVKDAIRRAGHKPTVKIQLDWYY